MDSKIVKNKINEIYLQWKSTGDEIEDLKDSDLLEHEVIELIVDYAETKGYQLEGYTTEAIKKLNYDGYSWYVDTLTLKYPDIADLSWYYVSTFWKDQFESEEEYLEAIKGCLASPELFYDLESDE